MAEEKTTKVAFSLPDKEDDEVFPKDEEVEMVKKRQRFKEDAQRRLSLAYEIGKEGKFVAKGTHSGKSIAVFTSGGDAQGMVNLFLFIYLFIRVYWANVTYFNCR